MGSLLTTLNKLKMTSVAAASHTTETESISLNESEISLIRWEELALALEEHYHALELFERQPNGMPMGHR
jgi:hypothetical protein